MGLVLVWAVVFAGGCTEILEVLGQVSTPRIPAVPPRFTDLGGLGGDSHVALGVNDSGMIVGYSDDEEGRDIAFRWTEETGMVALPTAGGSMAQAFDVNASGVVCGISLTANEDAGPTPVVWMANDEVLVLPRLVEDGIAEANAINDAGRVVGGVNDENGDRQACLWEADGTLVLLGSIGGMRSSAQGINNRSQVVGIATNADGETRGFLWTEDEGMIDIGTLGGNLGEAFDIDEQGRIIGRANRTEGGNRFAYVRSADGQFTDFDALGGTGSQGFGINEDGIVVGSSSTAGGNAKAFFGTVDSGMIFQLPDNGGRNQNAARSVNSSGMIVGFVNDSQGRTRAVFWQLEP
jgi:probable HAF family extracellular repeat protein